MTITDNPLNSNGDSFNGSEFEQPATGVWKPERRPSASANGRPEQLQTLLDAGLGAQEFREPANGAWNATLQLKVRQTFNTVLPFRHSQHCKLN